MTTPIYLGTWKLLPELSLYDDLGESPTEATYTISGTTENLSFLIAWTSKDGSKHTVEFSGPADGQRFSVTTNGSSEASIQHINAHHLESSSHIAGKLVSFAKRLVSSDGQLLVVLQDSYATNGSLSRRYQVYRRAEGEA